MRFLLLFTLIRMQMIKVLKVMSLRTRKLGRMHLQIMAMQRRDQERQARALGRDEVTLLMGAPHRALRLEARMAAQPQQRMRAGARQAAMCFGDLEVHVRTSLRPALG
jgi:hypothetical protein